MTAPLAQQRGHFVSDGPWLSIIGDRADAIAIQWIATIKKIIWWMGINRGLDGGALIDKQQLLDKEKT